MRMYEGKNIREIMRRFLIRIDRAPHDICHLISEKNLEEISMRQGYIFKGRRVIELRHETPSSFKPVFYVSFKKESGLKSVKTERKISQKKFSILFKRIGCSLWRMKYIINYGNRLIQFSHFFYHDMYNVHNNFWLAEIVFSSLEECGTFSVPSWFDKEITDDERYMEHNLAKHGLPKDDEIIESCKNASM